MQLVVAADIDESVLGDKAMHRNVGCIPVVQHMEQRNVDPCSLSLRLPLSLSPSLPLSLSLFEYQRGALTCARRARGQARGGARAAGAGQHMPCRVACAAAGRPLLAHRQGL
jgi:hypothetical protein